MKRIVALKRPKRVKRAKLAKRPPIPTFHRFAGKAGSAPLTGVLLAQAAKGTKRKLS
jgi:hypothetical protein